MQKLKGDIFVEAPVEVVAGLGLDVRSWPRWAPALHSVSAEAGFPEAGRTATLEYRVGLVPINITLRSEGYEPGRSVTFSFEGAALGTNRWEYTPEEGGARVTCALSFEVPGGDFGESFYKGVVQRLLIENMAAMLEKLAATAEREHAAA